ncbi:hypothetical protein Aura_00034 [Pseudomonas phage vB_PpuM-Aura]
MKAFCLHPLLQDYDMLELHWRKLAGDRLVSREALVLAMEYRRAANTYLCRPETDGYSLEDAQQAIGMLLPEVKQMLIADKRQNQKDFLIHHAETHPRREQLTVYFKRWLLILEGPPNGKP